MPPKKTTTGKAGAPSETPAETPKAPEDTPAPESTRSLFDIVSANKGIAFAAGSALLRRHPLGRAAALALSSEEGRNAAVAAAKMADEALSKATGKTAAELGKAAAGKVGEAIQRHLPKGPDKNDGPR